ncbi:Uncharacterised protein [Salmonella enterica subsp. diarizonae]|nr:Uncharacterised protein [Salmonella enterica subsp. diarizonae]
MRQPEKLLLYAKWFVVWLGCFRRFLTAEYIPACSLPRGYV